MANESPGCRVNPYQSPTTVAPALNPPICVDHPYLVVSDKAILPNRCVITNEHIDATDVRHRRFAWSKSFRMAMRRNRFRIAYGVNSRYRRARLKQNVVGTVVVILFLFVLAQVHVTFWLLLFPILASSWRPDPIKVVKAKGGHYWLSGLGEEFLESCESEFGTYQA